jgi:hypothetical protein
MDRPGNPTDRTECGGKVDPLGAELVPGITFTKEFQPELLTPVTKGVIEDVRGPISGTGVLTVATCPGALSSASRSVKWIVPAIPLTGPSAAARCSSPNCSPR